MPNSYQHLYQQSIKDPAGFWTEQAHKKLEWFKPFTTPFVWDKKKPAYQWFKGGQLNVTHNCLDRHITAGRGKQLAYIYNNELEEETRITYRQLLTLVNKTANALRDLGVNAGDRVIIYMPLTIEQIAIMLACARLGAIHSVVYAGFSAEALSLRIHDVQAKIVCTATSTQKNGKRHDLLAVVRQAVKKNKQVKKTIVLQRSWDNITLQNNELDFNQLVDNCSEKCKPLPVESSTPLFILHTSGTTGTPKGIVHGHGGYSLFTHITMEYIFADTKIHWTAADTGWITGHSYIVYGPLSNGITSVIYEGSPLYPTPGRYWELVERYRVESFYTAPTVIRLLMREGHTYPDKHNISSLRILGSVGEPINPVAWEWYAKHIGKNQAPVVDTWWQTETGGHMLATPPSLPQKAGYAGLPFLGIQPSIIDDDGNHITKPGTVGHLVIKHPWPGALLTCWNNPDRFAQYWQEFAGKNYFYTGDVAACNTNGYYMVLGRADDVISVAGIRIDATEVESVLVAHPSIAEAAVIGISDKIKGEVIKAFVLLNPNVTMSDQLQTDLKLWVRQKIGYMAEPTTIDYVEKLPKTRSGKIMRRVLKARELGLQLDDVSTLED